MAYRIEYSGKKRARRFPFWVLLAAALALLAIPKQEIARWLLPGDPDVTAQALSQLLDTLRRGSNAGQAVAAFCKSVVQGAGLG